MYQKIGLKMATSYSPNFTMPKRLKKNFKLNHMVKEILFKITISFIKDKFRWEYQV